MTPDPAGDDAAGDNPAGDNPTGDNPTGDNPVEARRLAAKQPGGLAAGRYGQPLHPLLVTIPIGAWVISFAFDLAAHTANEEFVYSRAAFWLIGVGIVGAIAAAVPGIIDLLNLARGTPAFRTGIKHLVLSDIALVAFAISFVVRRGDDSLQAASAPVMLLSVVALAALAASAWTGVRLTYRYGVRVADEATQREGFVIRATASPAPEDIDKTAEVVT